MIKRLLLITLSLFLFGTEKCEKQRQQAAIDAVQGQSVGTGPTGDCSLTGNPNLEKALDLNKRLSSSVENVSNKCRAAAKALSGGHMATLQTNLNGLRYDHNSTERLHDEISDLKKEISYLKSQNNPAHQDLIANLESQLSDRESTLRDQKNTNKLNKKSRKENAIVNMPQIYSDYDNAFSKCKGSHPSIMASMVRSGVALASSMGGMASGAAIAAQLLVNLAGAIGDSMESMNDQIKAEFGKTRAPYVLLCSVEAVTKVYCKSKRAFYDHKNPLEQQETCSCKVMRGGYSQLSSFRAILGELKQLYPNTQHHLRNPSNQGEPKYIDRAGAAQKNQQLIDRMGDIENYVGIVEAKAKKARGASARIARQEVKSVRDQIAQIKKVQQSGDLTSLAKMFQGPGNNLYDSMKTLSQLHQNILEKQLSRDLKTKKISSAEHATAYGLLSKESAVNSSAAVMGLVAKPPQASHATTRRQLENAIYMQKQNISNFSKFIQENSPIESIIDSVASKGAGYGPVDLEARNGVVKQLCMASLTLFVETRVPDSIIKRCQKHNPTESTSFAQLAKKRHDKRACVPIDHGQMGNN